VLPVQGVVNVNAYPSPPPVRHQHSPLGQPRRPALPSPPAASLSQLVPAPAPPPRRKRRKNVAVLLVESPAEPQVATDMSISKSKEKPTVFPSSTFSAFPICKIKCACPCVRGFGTSRGSARVMCLVTRRFCCIVGLDAMRRRGVGPWAVLVRFSLSLSLPLPSPSFSLPSW